MILPDISALQTLDTGVQASGLRNVFVSYKNFTCGSRGWGPRLENIWVPSKGMVEDRCSAGGAQSRFSGELNAADSDGPSSFVMNTYAGAPGGIFVCLGYDLIILDHI